MDKVNLILISGDLQELLFKGRPYGSCWAKLIKMSPDWFLAGEGEMLSEDKQGNKDGLKAKKEVEILKKKLIEVLTENSALKDRIIELEKKNS